MHPDFADKALICKLESGFVFLEDNSHFSWIILAFKRNVRNMLELTLEERYQLIRDIGICERAIDSTYKPFQINVAALGNKTPWLHFHIIGRMKDDICFPSHPFDVNPKPYSLNEKNIEIQKIKNFIDSVL